MTSMRPDSPISTLPPLRSGPAPGRTMPCLANRLILLRGGLVLAALALPVLGLRVAERIVPSPDDGAAQVLAMRPVAPSRPAHRLMAAIEDVR